MVILTNSAGVSHRSRSLVIGISPTVFGVRAYCSTVFRVGDLTFWMAMEQNKFAVILTNSAGASHRSRHPYDRS